MNNDFLRLGSKDEKDGIVEGEVSRKKKDRENAEKTGVFNIFGFAKNKKTGKNEFRSLFLPFSLMIIAIILLFIIAFVSFDVKIFTISLIATSLIFPLFFLILAGKTVLYEKFSVSESVIYTFSGLFAFTVIKFALSKLLSVLPDVRWTDNIINIVAENSLMFVFALVCAVIARKDDVFSAVFITVCVFSGMQISKSVFSVAEKLFKDAEKLGSLKNFFDGLSPWFFLLVIKSNVLSAILSFTNAIINGFAIGFLISPVKEKGVKKISFLIFFILTLLFSVTADFPTIIISLFIILNLLSVFCSAFLAIKIFAYVLSANKR